MEIIAKHYEATFAEPQTDYIQRNAHHVYEFAWIC